MDEDKDEPKQRGIFVRIKDAAFIRIKEVALFKWSIKIFGTLFSFSIGKVAFGFAGTVVAGSILFAGDAIDPFEGTPILAQQETAPNILIEIRNEIRELVEREFPPGQGLPDDFRNQVDDIETRLADTEQTVDCIAALLDGAEVSCSGE